MKTSKIIFHVDLDAFYAACEMAENVEYDDLPMIVAKNDVFKKSIILSPNYKARAYGIKTTMLISEAIKICPNIQIVEPNMHLYSFYSDRFFKYLRTITKKVEAASIDEAYLDVSEMCEGADAIDLAKRIQKDIMDMFKLSISIGIAPNKFLAKMASDMNKPLGITILRKREISTKLWPLNIIKMNGIGPKTALKLEEIKILTIGDLANYNNQELLSNVIGPKNAKNLVEKANGKDLSLVEYENYDAALSISNSHTFEINIFDLDYLKKTLRYLINSVVYRMGLKNYKAQTIGLQMKFSDFKVISRSRSLDEPSDDDYLFYEILESILEENLSEIFEVRLLGVFVNRLIESSDLKQQFDLFTKPKVVDKENKIQELISDIKNRCGNNSIGIGHKKNKDKEVWNVR